MRRVYAAETAVVASSPEEIDPTDSSRGTLPLKKRKLSEYDSPASPHQERFFAVRKDEKFAALTLLATAAMPLQDSPEPSPSPHRVSETEKVVDRSDANLVGSALVDPDLETGTKSSLNDQQQHHNRSRVHHPPLDAPLPGGCHGRTSRNNSYCRRHPCYNGSKYCKLHYQQYIVAGTRVPAGAVANSNGMPLPGFTHQDKRFTGCDGESRCLATTTRGRACAYVSVNQTKYCHLHADYDTNPPPRRGGGSGSGNRSRQMFAKAIMLDLSGCPQTPNLADGMYPSPGNVSIEEGQAITSSRLEAVKNKIYSMARIANGRPLLSSMSSDQWFHKRVVIGTGPLINRRGVVEKWGNGWVTVRVGDGVLHNRRSIELFLLPDKGEDSDSSASDDKSVTRYVSEDLASSTTSPTSSDQPLRAPDESAGSIPYLQSGQVSSDILASSTITVPASPIPSLKKEDNEREPLNQEVSSHLSLLSEVASGSTNRLFCGLSGKTDDSSVLR